MFSALSTWCLARSIPSLFHLKQHTPNICLRNIDDEWMVLLNPPYPLLILQGKPRNQCFIFFPLQHFLNISHSVSIECFLIEGSGLQAVTPYDILYTSHPLRVIVFGTNRLFSGRGGQGWTVGGTIVVRRFDYLCLNQNTSKLWTIHLSRVSISMKLVLSSRFFIHGTLQYLKPKCDNVKIS